MLLTMRACTEAARALGYVTAAALDRAHRHPDADVRERELAFAELMIPIVKGWSTEMAQQSPRSACRSTAAWASSRSPARRSTCATRGSRRSTKARPASRRTISSAARSRAMAARRSPQRSWPCAIPDAGSPNAGAMRSRPSAPGSRQASTRSTLAARFVVERFRRGSAGGSGRRGAVSRARGHRLWRRASWRAPRSSLRECSRRRRRRSVLAGENRDRASLRRSLPHARRRIARHGHGRRGERARVR